MRQGFYPSRGSAQINVIGAGVAGTWQALLFAKAGYAVALYERSGRELTHAASRCAGGMLAPWCEEESAEPLIARLGERSLNLWREHVPGAAFNGSLVVAHVRDRADYQRFSRLTRNYQHIDGTRIAAMEPALAGRFNDALFFSGEGHVEPRRVLPTLHERLVAYGVPIHFHATSSPQELDGTVIDCRGLAARDADDETTATLRGVKGEFVIVETEEIALARPVRLIHPRWPLYIIPRAGNRFMIGATSIESEDGGVSVRSVLELLSAAYAVHPAFAEARVVEFDAGLRPAFPDNLPRICVRGTQIAVNGLYRHGFLLAPALAEMTVAYVASGAIDNEVMQCN